MYCISSSCYEVLRTLLPFPCQSVLRTRYSPQIGLIEQRLINENEIETTPKIFLEKDFEEEIVLFTLAVDAFTVSNIYPKINRASS